MQGDRGLVWIDHHTQGGLHTSSAFSCPELRASAAHGAQLGRGERMNASDARSADLWSRHAWQSSAAQHGRSGCKQDRSASALTVEICVLARAPHQSETPSSDRSHPPSFFFFSFLRVLLAFLARLIHLLLRRTAHSCFTTSTLGLHPLLLATPGRATAQRQRSSGKSIQSGVRASRGLSIAEGEGIYCRKGHETFKYVRDRYARDQAPVVVRHPSRS
ncbi:hypothetical protein CBOM_07390 [Ceraceosorus bombacis]|uniref:Uncharacterized protein n=1 Tax=Ceraceosorus bombacis TaxID=401625 RepID=A0A0P1BC56_9BASI|nr:hypothetical protein CBOM_07390 [Ceraceosorus bombacis]